jgi:hypothetical protein
MTEHGQIVDGVDCGAWECPCGQEAAEPGSTTRPVRTLVSLREPACPFCGGPFEKRYRPEAAKARRSAKPHRFDGQLDIYDALDGDGL